MKTQCQKLQREIEKNQTTHKNFSLSSPFATFSTFAFFPFSTSSAFPLSSSTNRPSPWQQLLFFLQQSAQLLKQKASGGW
jgi:hypothetical protein